MHENLNTHLEVAVAPFAMNGKRLGLAVLRSANPNHTTLLRRSVDNNEMYTDGMVRHLIGDDGYCSQTNTVVENRMGYIGQYDRVVRIGYLALVRNDWDATTLIPLWRAHIELEPTDRKILKSAHADLEEHAYHRNWPVLSHLLQDEFTVPDAYNVYVALSKKTQHPSTFARDFRRIAPIEATGAKRQQPRGRHAQLFRYIGD